MMSAEFTPSRADTTSVSTDSNPIPKGDSSTRHWLLSRICSQNPFYLLSVCFVLHGTAHWFHADSGVAFSPWPLFWLTAGYTLLMAITGFVIIRFGHVWDDARSILLIILLLFVQLSLIFDETLIQDPVAGRLLLFTCWVFSAVLSESLLIGLRIRLPWLYRLPYHGLLTLLYFYPLSLVAVGTRLPTETVLWRIFLFPAAAALVLLTLIPAIRRSDAYTRHNGTPWLWPWYPWSLFVFLGVCVCFRAYALSQSFDPVLTESTASAMSFTTAFGVYFLIPVLFASGFLLLEIGLTQNRQAVVQLALFVPLLGWMLSFPAAATFGPYDAFLQMLLRDVGSPVWLTLLGAIVFYGIATLRRIPSAERWLGMTLLIATRIGPQTVDFGTLSPPNWWPFVTLSAIEVFLGFHRRDSRQMMIALAAVIAVLNSGMSSMESIPTMAQPAILSSLLILSILVTGALFHDDFAWLLRLAGAPLLVVATIAGCVLLARTSMNVPVWTGPAFVIAVTLIGLAYSVLVGMPLYRLASFLCGVTGSLGLAEMAAAYLIRESGWRGAASFVTGMGCLVLATMISSWKAGWLDRVPSRTRELLSGFVHTPRTSG